MAAKKSKYASIETYNPSDAVRYEPVSDEKLTVTGESYTIQELFARYQKGHNPVQGSNAYYEDTLDFGAVDLSKLRGMDIFDRTELYRELKEKADSALKLIEEHQKQSEASKAQESDERSVEAESEPIKAEESNGDETSTS
jgi:hypothetical protein